MIITIDTSKDSKEEISKVIRMLQSLVGNEVYSNQPSQNVFEQASPELLQGNVLGDFFANVGNPNKATTEKKEDTAKVVEYY